ncbi:helix-turn-helix domain-containing protein [Paenibacillus hodogayensis]|uniref:Helix-turn-helix domain-containing protein n=1 Tax=Paenibacillus hodogayensis TaxID=279208 RepID=A0ABV5W7N0_9BACL
MTGSWSRIRASIRRNGFLLKILLSYIATGSILLGALSFMMYAQYSRSFLDEIRKSSEKALSQSYNVVETYWASTLGYLTQFHIFYNIPTGANDQVSAGTLFSALFAEAHESLQMGDISRKLSEIVVSNPIIESVYVINRKADKVFSNLTVAQPVDQFFDQAIVDYVSTHTFKGEYTVYPRRVNFTYAYKTADYNAISVLFVEETHDGRPVSVLVFNLKQSALQQLANPQSDNDANRIFIVDRDGLVISHPEMNRVNTNIADEGDYIKTILGTEQSSGSFTSDINGSKSLVAYKKSTAMFDWTFVSVGDYNKLLWSLSKLGNAIFLLTGLFVVLSIGTAVWFTRNTVRPLRRLLRKVKTSTQPSNEREAYTEYEALDHLVDNLVHNVDELKASVREGMPAVKSDLLKRLLHGAVASQKDWNDMADKHHIRLASPFYAVCVLRICSFQSLADRSTSRDLALIRFAIMNIASETFGPDYAYAIEAVDGEADHIALIVNLDEGQAGELGDLKPVLAKTQGHVRSYLGLTVTASVGAPAAALRDIHQSYKSALRLSDYRLIFGKSAILLQADIPAPEREAYEYPLDLEKKLIEAIRAGEQERADEIVGDILQRVQRFSYDEILLSLTQLALASAGSAQGAATDEETDGVGLSFKAIMHELDGCDDPEDVRSWFRKLTGTLIEINRSKRDGKNKELVNKIQSFVDAGFRDPNLTVEAVSEHVGLSANYVRTIFKNHTDRSLSAYIGELRFGEAKRLLLETDEHANKIAELVGFGSGKYFYSAFKKAVGQTPDEFRRSPGERSATSE